MFAGRRLTADYSRLSGVTPPQALCPANAYWALARQKLQVYLLHPCASLSPATSSFQEPIFSHRMASQAIPDFEPKNIFAAVSQLGITGDCPTLDGEFDGGECRIFKLSFKGEANVAVRVRHPNSGSSDFAIDLVQKEVRIHDELKAKGFPWAPTCLGASLTFDNPVNYPFVVLTWAEGLSLSWDDDYPPRPLRDSLLGQIASIQLSLIHCTLQNGTGPTQVTNCRSYY